jgi:hypothetical protein
MSVTRTGLEARSDIGSTQRTHDMQDQFSSKMGELRARSSGHDNGSHHAGHSHGGDRSHLTHPRGHDIMRHMDTMAPSSPAIDTTATDASAADAVDTSTDTSATDTVDTSADTATADASSTDTSAADATDTSTDTTAADATDGSTDTAAADATDTSTDTAAADATDTSTDTAAADATDTSADTAAADATDTSIDAAATDAAADPSVDDLSQTTADTMSTAPRTELFICGTANPTHVKSL